MPRRWNAGGKHPPHDDLRRLFLVATALDQEIDHRRHCGRDRWAGAGLALALIGDVVALRLGLERIDAGFEVVEGLEFLLRHAFPRVLGDHHVQAFRPSKVLSSLSGPWAKAWRGDLRAVPRRSTDGGSVCMGP